MFVALYITPKDITEAQNIAQALLEERLIGCANIIPSVESRYWWEGAIAKDNEALLIAKTKKSLVKKAISKVKSIHSYSVPCINVIPIIDGNPDYLKWLSNSLK